MLNKIKRISIMDIKKFREEFKLRPEQLAEIAGVAVRTVRSWEDGARNPSESALKILNAYKQSHADKNDESTVDRVPLLPVAAQAGSLNDFLVSVNGNGYEKVISPVKGADFALMVSGDSMSPEYPSGSHIFVKRIDETAFIDWGKVYVLDTCNGSVIKRIFPADDKNPERVKCVSINPDYPFFEIKLSDVFGIYRVLLCMAVK